MTDNHSASLTKFQDLDSIWNPLDAKSSVSTYRTLLEEAEKLQGGDRCHWIELLSLIARAEGFQKNFTEAHALLDQAEKLLNEKEAAYRVTARIRWLLEKGRLHIYEKTPSQARTFFSEAWTLAFNSGEDYFSVEIAQLMATTEPMKTQQDWIQRAIGIAENSPMPKTKKSLGNLYASLAWKLYDLRQYEKALEVFQKALRHLKANGTPREAFVAQWSIGKVLRTLGKTEEALAIQKVLVSELGLSGAKDGRLYEEVAECLQTLDRTTEAQLYFELAYKELSSDEWVTDNQPVKLKRMKDLGKVKSERHTNK